jgi:hypothetical protein
MGGICSVSGTCRTFGVRCAITLHIDQTKSSLETVRDESESPTAVVGYGCDDPPGRTSVKANGAQATMAATRPR